MTDLGEMMPIRNAVLYANSLGANRETEATPDLPGVLARDLRADDQWRCGCQSLPDLRAAFVRLAEGAGRGEVKLDLLRLIAHGAPGHLDIGVDALNLRTVGRLDSTGIERSFKQKAQVELLGCDVAAGVSGELLTVRLAWLLLRKAGGTVRASTTTVRVDDLLHTGAALAWGAILAVVSPGGGVTLHGARHLDRLRLKQRLAGLEDWRRSDGRQLSDYLRGKLDKYLATAKRNLAAAGAWDRLADAASAIELAEGTRRDAYR